MDVWIFKPENAARLRKHMPVGTRVYLIHSSSPFCDLPDEAEGTLESIEDNGLIHVKWDCGIKYTITFPKEIIGRISDKIQ